MNYSNKYLPYINNKNNNYYIYNNSRNAPTPPPPPSKKKNPPKKKFDFISFKKNTCNSLNEVECFLNNFSEFFRYAKIIKLLK